MRALCLGVSIAIMSACGTTAVHAQDKIAITTNMVQAWKTLDPAKMIDFNTYVSAVNLYDGLTTVDENGNIAPNLAESWTVSPDGKIFTFMLRANVIFQDGSPLQAADVVWSIQRFIAIDEAPASTIRGLIKPENITAPDPSTVRIELNAAFSPFLSITPSLLVLNKALVEKSSTGPDKWGQSYVDGHAAGSGPYSLVSFNRTSEMVIRRNPSYWRGFPRARPIDEIRFVVTNDEATVKALATRGDLGLSNYNNSYDTVQQIGTMPGYKIIDVTSPKGLWIKMNTKVYPTDDIHVRRAIQLAFDYDTVRTQIQPGALPMRGPLPQMFAAAFNDTIKAPVRDLAAAKAELAKSKYAGQQIVLPHVYLSSLDNEAQIALLFQANMEQIGLKVNIQPETWNRITDLAATEKTTPATTQILIAATYPSPDSVFFKFYHPAAAGTFWSMEWLNDPETTALINKSRVVATPDAANGIYKQLQQRIVDLAPDVLIYAAPVRFAASKCLQGYAPRLMTGWDFDFANLYWQCPAT